MNGAKYLVQARSHGGPWTTLLSCPSHYDNALDDAKCSADLVAAQSKNAGLNGAPIPEYDYVRVAWRGATVYDPRAERKAS